MTDLSPAAQAVLATYGAEIGGIDAIMGSERRGLAAALRVVATEVVLDKYQYADRDAQLRRNIFAIAAELEALP